MNPETIQINIGFIEGIIGIIAVIVSVGFAWGKLNTKVEDLKEYFVDAKDGINKRIDKVDGRMEKLEIKIEKIETKLGDHGESIASINATFGAFGIHGSPMKPSEEGEKILKESGFYELYPDIKNKVFDILDKMQTRTLYDIEINSRIVLKDLIGNPLFDNMKNYVVNNPERPLELIFGIASWVIRDDYAKERNIIK